MHTHFTYVFTDIVNDQHLIFTNLGLFNISCRFFLSCQVICDNTNRLCKGKGLESKYETKYFYCMLNFHICFCFVF